MTVIPLFVWFCCNLWRTWHKNLQVTGCQFQWVCKECTWLSQLVWMQQVEKYLSSRNCTVPWILPKMSLDYCCIGGYDLYFNPPAVIKISDTISIPLHGFPAWTKDDMPLRRFKQIQAAYHQEVGLSTINDKYLQLCYAINVFNNVAKIAFAPGTNMSFDEGGFGCCTHLCPVRVYNQSKPALVNLSWQWHNFKLDLQAN